jgi:hypothetical protein
MSPTIRGVDGKTRCRWCAAAPEFLGYHDTEWGFPVADDRRLFEKLSLEGFQSQDVPADFEYFLAEHLPEGAAGQDTTAGEPAGQAYEDPIF